jgi:hypothetical protein
MSERGYSIIALHRISLLLGLLFGALLVGCQTPIVVTRDAEATAQPVCTVAPASHAVALIGVEFDPPLDSQTLASGAGVTLLVALENRGLALEKEVRVTAQLFDASEGADGGKLLDEFVVVRSLAPGEVGLARFGRVTDLPVRSRYTLRTTVEAVAGERDLGDNQRTFDIVVSGVR